MISNIEIYYSYIIKLYITNIIAKKLIIINFNWAILNTQRNISMSYPSLLVSNSSLLWGWLGQRWTSFNFILIITEKNILNKCFCENVSFIPHLVYYLFFSSGYNLIKSPFQAIRGFLRIVHIHYSHLKTIVLSVYIFPASSWNKYSPHNQRVSMVVNWTTQQ